jgi:kynureninase
MSGPTRADAEALDRSDPLAPFRHRFVIDEDGPIYVDGNSLGRLPRATVERLRGVVEDEWGRGLIGSWTQWMDQARRVGDAIAADVIGAKPGEVVVADSTTVNLYKLAVAALDARPDRTVVVTDAGNFPTDRFVLQGLAQARGLELRLLPEDPTVDDVETAVGAGDVALVTLSLVAYRSGALLDLDGITGAAHRHGALTLWDLSHAAGAVPIDLAASGVDLAVGCTYKYLNGGPGSPAYLYVAERHQAGFDSPLPGWTSHAEPFGMTPGYVPADGSVRGRVGTPDILSMLALEASLDVWEGVAVEAVRAKSLALTDFFLECVAAYVPEGRVVPVTPAAHAERGSQVSLRCESADEAEAVMRALIERGVVGDLRRPDVLRFGFTPLYVGFADTERAARILAEVLAV